MDASLSTLQNPELPALNERRRCGIITEARDIQRLILERLQRPKITDAALAALSRSYCLLAETVRVWKGIPAPGQLRPDLDPVQLQRAIKRARARRPLDIGAGIRETLATISETAEEPGPTTPKPTKTGTDDAAGKP